MLADILLVFGKLPRVKPSTKGEGHERRYFYGSVWAVCIAQPVLWFMWKVLPRSRPARRTVCWSSARSISPIVGIDSLREAVQLANASRYGLLASVYTADLATGLAFINEHKAAREFEIRRQKEDETPDKRSGPGDYYLIAAEYTTWYVSPETAARVGRDLERQVLARAVRGHVEDRIIVNGNKTIVFG